MKVVFFSAKSYDQEFFSPLANDHEWVFVDSRLTEFTSVLAVGSDAICCFVNDSLNAAVLEQLHSMKIPLVLLRCAGFNNVDVATAQRLGICVARVPEYSPFSVAEHTVGLILDLNRNIHRAYNRIRENDYSLTGLLGFDLNGKTVGVIGTGKIGQVFIRIMQGFGCRILAYDPAPLALPNVDFVSLDELLAQSRIISLHCPLTPETHHIINSNSLQKMQAGVMLINTSRGGLIDTPAVIDFLKSGHLGYLGIDVYEEEAEIFFEDHSNFIAQDDVFARLTTFPNVIITGHQAFFTREALQKIAQVTVNNLNHFCNKEFDLIFRVVSI